MGKIVERKKKKKKGRPSLLDLQKRNLKQQIQQQQHHYHHKQKQKQKHHPNNSTPHPSPNYKSATPTSTPLRRSTRRNLTPSSPDTVHEDEEDVPLIGKRREKKLKLVLKLPQNSDSNATDSKHDDDHNTASKLRKRKIDAIADGSTQKGEKSAAATNPANNVQDSGPSTPLPDKELLLFILDRLQKKDKYGVFSEPVDLKELPDYLEVIVHPMDFGTVRKNLSGGLYATLEQFEKDVFLICSNAMQYNASDTVYFRQARSIQELAKKNFENLRQDSDDNEPEPKVVRRGRPPTKNFKKPAGKPSLDYAGSEFSSDATLATGTESAVWSCNDLRKGPRLSDKVGSTDSLGQFRGPQNDSSWLIDNKFDRTDEATVLFKGNSMKHGKKQFAQDESRRNTYRQFHPSAAGCEPSVLTPFDAGMKQLMTVGLLTEYGYARSLARFAANVRSVAWKIASKRIERSLPPGVKFGPGWVGENDIPPQRSSILHLPSPLPGQRTSSHQLSLPESLSAAARPCPVEAKEDGRKPEEVILLQKQLPSTHKTSDGHPSIPLSSSILMSTSPSGANELEIHKERAEAIEGLNSHAGFNEVNSSMGMVRTRPPFQTHHVPGIHPGLNGVNGSYGFNLPAQMGKVIGASRPSGFNLQSCQMVDTVSRTSTNSVHPAKASGISSESPKLPDNSSTVNSCGLLPSSGNEAVGAPRSGLPSGPSWHGLPPQSKTDSTLSPQQKSDAVPPDLNVRFQSPGSPSSIRVDSTQPDLALQL